MAEPPAADGAKLAAISYDNAAFAMLHKLPQQLCLRRLRAGQPVCCIDTVNAKK